MDPVGLLSVARQGVKVRCIYRCIYRDGLYVYGRSIYRYGLPKTDLPEETPTNVVIVDVGHAHTQVSAVAFVRLRAVLYACPYTCLCTC